MANNFPSGQFIGHIADGAITLNLPEDFDGDRQALIATLQNFHNRVMSTRIPASQPSSSPVERLRELQPPRRIHPRVREKPEEVGLKCCLWIAIAMYQSRTVLPASTYEKSLGTAKILLKQTEKHDRVRYVIAFSPWMQQKHV